MPSTDPTDKYIPFQPIDLPDRSWPGAVITRPPVWCSVDLRDGNQALDRAHGPPSASCRFFDLLVRMGFKEIEVGFPSASADRLRLPAACMIDENLIPDDVTIQVLTQARDAADPPHLSRRSPGRKRRHRASVQLDLHPAAAGGVRPGPGRHHRHRRRRHQADAGNAPTPWTAAGDRDPVYQYSPESFTGTELDFAVEICDAVNGGLGCRRRATRSLSTCRQRWRWRRPTSTPTRSNGSAPQPRKNRDSTTC